MLCLTVTACQSSSNDFTLEDANQIHSVKFLGFDLVNTGSCAPFYIVLENQDGDLIRVNKDVSVQLSAKNAQIFEDDLCLTANDTITVKNNEFRGQGYVQSQTLGTYDVYYQSSTIASVKVEVFSTSFSEALDGEVKSILPNAAGQLGIIVGGDFGLTQGRSLGDLIKVNIDGTLDERFIHDQKLNLAPSTMVAIGKNSNAFYIIGSLSFGNVFIQGLGKIFYHGQYDPVFSNAQGRVFLSKMAGGAMDNQGRLVIGGRATKYANQNIRGLIRLNPDAQIDDFIADDLLFDYTQTSAAGIYEIKIDQNQNIYAMGSITTFGSSQHYGHMVRIRPDGTRDASFAPGFSGPTNTMVFTSTRDMIVGGSFTTIAGTSQKRLTKITAQGDVDTSFLASGQGFDAEVKALLSDSQDRVYVGGNFTTFNGNATEKLIRLLPDGTIDHTFSPTFNGKINTIVSASDGSNDLWIGGGFTLVNGQPQKYLVRLDEQGNID